MLRPSNDRSARNGRRPRWPVLLWAAMASLGPAVAANGNTIVQFSTSLGTFNVDLYDNATPLTVSNFLSYVTSGAYTNTIIHRSVPGFVVQGGGFNEQFASVHANAPVKNEFLDSNLRGTIAMAKVGNDPNSATSQWFVNLGNNSSNLDNQNGGFTVFGRVLDNGMQTVDAIAGVPTFAYQSPFDQIPLRNWTQADFHSSMSPDSTNTVNVTSVTEVGTFTPVWQNADNRYEVAGRSYVSPLDALLVINAVHSSGAHALAATFSGSTHFDVNGDDFLSLADAQAVIDRLNAAPVGLQPVSTPVPEPSGLALIAVASAALAVLAARRRFGSR